MASVHVAHNARIGQGQEDETLVVLGEQRAPALLALQGTELRPEAPGKAHRVSATPVETGSHNGRTRS